MNFEKVKEHAACTEAHLRAIESLCRSAPPGDFMECGVLRGGTAAILVDAAGPGRRVWLFDSFKDCTWKGPKDPDTAIKQSVGYSISEVTAYLRQCEVPQDNVTFVQGLFGDTLPEFIKRIDKLALVHFDGDWYESVMQAFPHILPKLEPGGILIIHDYPKLKGLVEAVHKFINKKHLQGLGRNPWTGNVYYVKVG